MILSVPSSLFVDKMAVKLDWSGYLHLILLAESLAVNY